MKRPRRKPASKGVIVNAVVSIEPADAIDVTDWLDRYTAAIVEANPLLSNGTLTTTDAA